MRKELNTRYHRLDSIRGIVLISMIAYHAVWDLVNVSGFDWDWYDSAAAFLWQQSICWSFILLSGFCWALGRHHVRRGITVTAASALVSAVTLLVMPDEGIIFGVLTLLGISMLIMIPLDKLIGMACGTSERTLCGASGRMHGGNSGRTLRGTSERMHGGTSERTLRGTSGRMHGGTSERMHGGTSERMLRGSSERELRGTLNDKRRRRRNLALSFIGAAVSFFWFLISKDARGGSIGIGQVFVCDLPEEIFLNYFTAFLGFPQSGFYSSDYFPLIPWFFLFLCGYFLFRVMSAAGALRIFAGRRESGPLKLMGRHSLLIYLLHQPVLYAGACLIKILAGR